MPATILVVEDEGDIAILLRYNLEAEGFRVVTAESGDEAQHAIQEKLPDLILLDWMLPEISGIELCRRLRAREDTSRVPINRSSLLMASTRVITGRLETMWTACSVRALRMP